PVRLTPAPTPGPYLVHVTGAVAHPDVYTLPPGSRVRDAVDAAGGLAPDADDSRLNLAAPLADGEQVYIPFQVQSAGQYFEAEGFQEESPQGLPQTGQPGERVNINSASLEELDSLPCIGPVTAHKIIAYRAENGPFLSIESIQDVPGIGPATFAKIKDLITTGVHP